MKDICVIALSLLPSTAAIIAAGLLAYNDLDGWGWFLFVAVLAFPRVTSHTD